MRSGGCVSFFLPACVLVDGLCVSVCDMSTTHLILYHRMAHFSLYLISHSFYAFVLQMDYVSKVIDLMRLVRPGKDELVLQNMHYLEHNHPMRPHALALNEIIAETAGMLSLPLLDLCALVKDDGKHLRKGDYRHQTAENSLLVAEQIGRRRWSYFRTTVSTITPPVS